MDVQALRKDGKKEDEDWWVASKADGSTGSECVFFSFRLAAFC